jgi:UDP-N-acetylglucosamine 2-epimerase (non-hydrolysing)
VARALEVVAAYRERIEIVPPLDYLHFAGALGSCRLVLTDSGGLQEEAPSLGKRVLVAREHTERPEGVEGGLNRVVGRERARVRKALLEAWQEPEYAGPLPAPNPYGDGRAGERIAETLERDLGEP